MEKLLQVRNLTKTYKKHTAVDNISFHIDQGEVVGLLGVNGAGKSTTINMLSTILKADDGEICYLGKDIGKNIREYKRNIGVVPQEIAIYENISAMDNVKYFARLYGIPSKEISNRCAEILKAVGLEERQSELPRNFSGGMKRRLNIACGLLHKPKLIIMDEPTVGVDVQSRKFILEFIKQLQKDGISVLYTTHYMEEVEVIADRIIVINAGKIIADGNLFDIRSIISHKKKILIEMEGHVDRLISSLKELSGVKMCEMEEDKLSIVVEEDQTKDIYHEITGIIYEDGGSIKEINTVRDNLETVFLNLTSSKEDA